MLTWDVSRSGHHGHSGQVLCSAEMWKMVGTGRMAPTCLATVDEMSKLVHHAEQTRSENTFKCLLT